MICIHTFFQTPQVPHLMPLVSMLAKALGVLCYVANTVQPHGGILLQLPHTAHSLGPLLPARWPSMAGCATAVILFKPVPRLMIAVHAAAMHVLNMCAVPGCGIWGAPVEVEKSDYVFGFFLAQDDAAPRLLPDSAKLAGRIDLLHIHALSFSACSPLHCE